MELIRLENLHKTYHLGEVDVPVLCGISLTIQRGEMVALMALRLRQDHADEYSRVPGPPQFRPILVRRPGNEPTYAERAGPGAHREARLRVPELQFAAANFGAAKRADAAGLCRPAALRQRSPAMGPRAVESRRTGRAGSPRAVANVGRPAAAGGDRPLARQSAHAPPGRRADGQPRFAYERRDPADVPAAQRRGHHRRPGHARCQRGRLRPSDHPYRGWNGRRR